MKARNWGLTLLMALSVGLAGCPIFLSAGVGYAAYAYASGEGRRSYFVDYDEAFACSEQLMKARGYKVLPTDRKKGVTEGSLRGQMDDGTEVFLLARYEGPQLTHVAIRVGTWGDEMLTQVLHDQLAGILEIDKRDKAVKNGN